jgi:hypothetical protein
MAHAHVRFHFWGSEIEAKPPEVEYESVMESDEGVALWTAKIVRHLDRLLPSIY